MSADRLVYDYNLQLNGVFGRNRTAKFKTIRLKRADRDGVQPTTEELQQLTDRTLAEIKFKTGKWVVKQAPVEVGDYFESFTIYSDVTLFNGSKG